MKNIKFIYKVMIFPALFAVLFITILFLSNSFNSQSRELLLESQEKFIPSIEKSILIGNNLDGIIRGLQDAMAAGDEYMLNDVDTIATNVETLCEELRAIDSTSKADSIKLVFKQYYKAGRMFTASWISADGAINDEVRNLMTPMGENLKSTKRLVKELNEYSKNESSSHFEKVKENFSNATRTMLLVVIIGIVVVLGISFLLTREIVLPIHRAVEYMTKISDKKINFEIDAKRKDEIGQLYKSINRIIQNFRTIIGSINETSNTVLNSGTHLSKLSQSMAQSSNQQAASAEQMSASIEEMLSSIEQNSNNAQEAKQIAKKAEEGIKEGTEASISTIEMMKEISEKITVINEIAERTDMLAINAAIEAARAGESGKGFSVVASEVRKLAEKSQNAAKEIIELTEKSLNVAEKSGNKLTAIVPDVQRTTQIVEEIAATSMEQESGTAQISTAINQLTSTTQQNTASAEELASESEEFVSQAEGLKAIMSSFVLEDKEDKTEEEILREQIKFLKEQLNQA